MSLQTSSSNASDALAIDPRALRRAFGQFATGVTIVTTRTSTGETIGLTVNSFSSVSIDPPLVLWSLSKASPNLQRFREAPYFCINVLAEHQHEIASQFAKPLPDKFRGIDTVASACGSPLLNDAVAHFECSRFEVYEGGDHLIFLGRVEQFCIFDRRPLLFHGGAFQQLADAMSSRTH